MSGILFPLLAFIAGFIILAISADMLVRGAVGIAYRLGVSPLVTGLTIVAFGTSAPELSVSIIAALSGSPDLTTGNIVGSNIANIGLVLGTGAMISSISLSKRLLKLEIPFLLLSGLAAWLFAMSGNLSRTGGALLFFLFCLYLWLVFTRKRGDDDYELSEVSSKGNKSMFLMICHVMAGITGLVGGSKLLVWGAVVIARYAGVSELVIGLTLTAVGTSLPELAATVVASRRGHGDIVIGNVIGSNLANIGGVLGGVAIISPIAVSRVVVLRDFPIMMAYTFFLLLCFLSKGSVGKVAGSILLFIYTIYMLCLGFMVS